MKLETKLLQADELDAIRKRANEHAYIYESQAPYDVLDLLAHIDALQARIDGLTKALQERE